ncbi:MAG TPA: hypothetical protein VGN35_02685 [Jatrophihabitantaceae bacterium]|jgi:hypothetical protein|nr:hypothetical protein [Jatrophihabitantaceae bacterium]
MEDAPTRRAVLLSAAAVVIAAAGGAAAAGFRPDPSRGRPSAPPELVAAAAAEAHLIALIDQVNTHPQPSAVLAGIRGDHAAHLAALQAALAAYPGTPASSTSPTSPTATPPSGSGPVGDRVARVRAAEQAAAAEAQARARILDGALATLLASISACEATHAALLS